MPTKSPLRIANVCLLLIAVCFSLYIIARHVQPSDVRNGLLVANWVLWLSFVITYPFALVGSGEVTGTNAFSRSSRAYEPARFWVGLVATTAFWLSFLLYISLLSYMGWYRGV
jgi:hypothetical protein